MSYYSILALVLFVYMSAAFVISLIRGRNDVADVAWGLGFVMMAWVSLYLGGTANLPGLIVCTLVTIWGFRLAWHIYVRNRGKPEDYRYAKWREDWGRWFYLRSYAQVYLLQGVLLYVVALPVLIVNAHPALGAGMIVAVGVGVWIVGFFFESVGDAQLARFIRNPDNKGKLMQEGLWKYTRHPNYFGEVTMWWGLWIVALSVPSGWLAVIGPLTITVLILKVSGVPLLESKMKNNPEFVEYARKTSMFLPRPPRS